VTDNCRPIAGSRYGVPSPARLGASSATSAWRSSSSRP